MHKRLRKGFTIVELVVIIIVISIISSLAMISYSQIQRESRNEQRITHIAILMNELEKFYDRHGEYPPGCPDTTCTSSMHLTNTSSAALTSTTSLTTLQSILPDIRDDFGDPQSTNVTMPFKNRTIAETKYYYFGGTVNDTGSGTPVVLDSPAHTNFPCTIRSSLITGQTGSYVVGYFDELANNWTLRGGRNGIPMTVAAGTCVIVRG